MELYFSVNENLDSLKISYTQDERVIFKREVVKDRFNDLELFSILHLNTLPNISEIESVYFAADKNHTIINKLISRLKNYFPENIKINELKSLNFGNIKKENVLNYDQDVINQNLNYISSDNTIEISYHNYKSLKKHVFNISYINNGEVNTFTHTSENQTFRHTYNELINLIGNVGDQNSQIIMRRSINNKANRMQSLALQEKIEFTMNRKVNLEVDNPFYNQEVRYKLEKNTLLRKREEKLKEYSDPNNICIFTDGSARDGRQSSAYIIKRGENIIHKEAFLFAKDSPNIFYEEIAFLKALEKLTEIENSGKIFIISDREDNIEILDGIYDRAEYTPIEQFDFLYKEVCKKIKESNVDNISFNALKSHTDANGYDFEGNRDVDNEAGMVIVASEEVPKEHIFNIDDIKNNRLLGVDAKYYFEIHKKEQKKLKETSPYGMIMNKKNLSLSRRNKFSANILYVSVNKHNKKNYASILFSNKGKTRIKDFFEYEDLQDYKRKLDNIINNISNNQLNNFVILSNNEKINEVNKDLICFNEEYESSKKLKALINMSNITAHYIEENKIYKNHFSTSGVKALAKASFNSKVLGIKPKKQINKAPKVKKVEPNIIDDFELLEEHFEGNKSLFPLTEDYNKEYEYLFVKEKNGNYNVNYVSKGFNISETINKNDDVMFEINRIFRKAPVTKNHKGFVLVADENIYNDFKKVTNDEDFFNCNVLKILKKKYREPKYLAINLNGLGEDVLKLKWFKDLNIKTEKKEIKKVIKLNSRNNSNKM